MDSQKFYHPPMPPHVLPVKTPVLDVRPIAKENFNPMCWHLLDFENDCQILVEVHGAPMWINAHKKDVK